MIYDTLESRHHVLRYKTKQIEASLVKQLLYQAWKITPSKNNFMPYTVTVLGPGCVQQKEKIYKKVALNHEGSDVKGLDIDSKANPKMEKEYRFVHNRSYWHILKNSHLLVFSSRVCSEPNEFYKRAINLEGHYAEQCEVDEVEEIAESTAFEVGLFASAMTALCLENGIDISYCACLPKYKAAWRNIPFVWYDKENKFAKVHSVMSLGYGDYYRYQWLKENNTTDSDIKPPFEDVVKWR